jgi:hypothetical protein
MKYHVVSLVAVFMALGVGIFLGSNTSFMDIETLLKKQDAVITALEQGQKALERDNKRIQGQIEDKDKRINDMEQKTIPLLMDGRLQNWRVALVAAGSFRNAGIDENAVASLLERADATVACRMRMPVEAFKTLQDRIASPLPAAFSAMLFSPAPDSAALAAIIKEQGHMMQCNLDAPLDAVVFLLGELPDGKDHAAMLKALNAALAENPAATALWTAYGGEEKLGALAADKEFPVILHAETIASQVDIVMDLWQKLESRREAFNPETDLQQPQ